MASTATILPMYRQREAQRLIVGVQKENDVTLLPSGHRTWSPGWGQITAAATTSSSLLCTVEHLADGLAVDVLLYYGIDKPSGKMVLL